MPSFFISHSTAGLPSTDRTVQIRDALADLLDGQGWNVFLDREANQPGDRWRTNVVYGLARADAAVVLFNEQATAKSSWVTAETFILSFHRSVDPQFQFVPVMLEGKTLEETAFAKYQPFELNQIQGFTDDPTVAPAEIASRIARLFDVRRSTITRNRWCVRVCSVLEEVKRKTLERAAALLDLQLDARTNLAPDDVACEWLSNAVVTVMHSTDPLKVVDSLAEVFVPLDDSRRLSLKNHVVAKWVPNESVEILLGAARNRTQIDLLTVESMAAAAVTQYINRVKIEFRSGIGWAFSVSAAPGDTDDAIVAHVENTIYESMVPTPFFDDDKNEIPMPQVIERVMVRPTDVAICVLHSSCARESVLSRLVDRNPRLLFVVQSSNVPDAIAFARIRSRSLEPPVTIGRLNELSLLVSRIDAALRSVSLN
jgi:hypothetical protein